MHAEYFTYIFKPQTACLPQTVKLVPAYLPFFSPTRERTRLFRFLIRPTPPHIY